MDKKQTRRRLGLAAVCFVLLPAALIANTTPAVRGDAQQRDRTSAHISGRRRSTAQGMSSWAMASYATTWNAANGTTPLSLSGVAPTGINNAGQIIADGGVKAFVWDGGQRQEGSRHARWTGQRPNPRLRHQRAWSGRRQFVHRDSGARGARLPVGRDERDDRSGNARRDEFDRLWDQRSRAGGGRLEHGHELLPRLLWDSINGMTDLTAAGCGCAEPSLHQQRRTDRRSE